MVTEDEIIDLVEDTSGGKLDDHQDIWRFSGMSGDDWHDFIIKYAHKYSVNMDGYQWYYHGDEEGLFNFGGFFYPPPQDQVTRIPLSVVDLTRIASNGVWDLNYPSETVDLSRRDLKINQIMFFLIITILILIIINNMLK